MHIITKKVRLIPASIWSGIRLTIEVPDDDPTWGIFASTAPAKSDINVEWGDGTSDHFTGSIRQETHTYPQGGRYFVTISDVITMLVISNANSDSPFHAKYAPRIIHFEAKNATPL